MSITFPRSLRSMQNDRSQSSLITLFVVAALLTAWSLWFFWAEITLYEASRSVHITAEDTIVANFSPEAARRIRRGQSAILRLEADARDQMKTIPARVMAVTNQNESGQFQVELFPLLKTSLLPVLNENSINQVEIEVEHISPIKLVMRASEQFFTTSPGSNK
jgi:hypothetical protein